MRRDQLFRIDTCRSGSDDQCEKDRPPAMSQRIKQFQEIDLDLIVVFKFLFHNSPFPFIVLMSYPSGYTSG